MYWNAMHEVFFGQENKQKLPLRSIQKDWDIFDFAQQFVSFIHDHEAWI